MSTLSPAAPSVNPTPSAVMSDAEFSAWCAGQWTLGSESTPEPADHLVDHHKKVDILATPEPADPYLVKEAWWAGFGYGSDGEPCNVPADYSAELADAFRLGYDSGFDCYEAVLAAESFAPKAEDEAEYLGFQLGADGVEAELCTPHAADRVAFERGHNAGDDHLWRVDPLFAAHLKERAERFELQGSWA